jgi:hypothetical protein
VHFWIGIAFLTLWCLKFLLMNFTAKVFQKLLLCDKIPHEKPYLSILNSNQDINDLRLLIFLTAHCYLTIFTANIVLLSRNRLVANNEQVKKNILKGLSRLFEAG